MNHLNGKYFHFFLPEKNSKILIKFKSANEKFYSANSIFKPTILSKLIYNINVDDTDYPGINETNFNLPIQIKNLKKFYYTYENINLIIDNKTAEEIKLNFVVLDNNLNIRFVYDDVLKADEQYKGIDFFLNSADDYKILFYCNNDFLFFTKIKIVDKPDKKKIEYSLPNEKLLYFRINNYKDILKYSIYNKFTGEKYNQLIKEEIKIKKQELYVPINNIIDNIEDDNFLRYLKVNKHTKYNAKGMYKIVQSIRYMNVKDQIKFIESLFSTDEKLAYMILNNVFNFYLLFIIPDTEKRELLKLVDTKTLAYALKSEPEEKKISIKKFINKKSYDTLETEIKNIKLTSTDEILKAQKVIGDILRAYYQLKFGVPFVIKKFKETRLKEQIFNNKLVFTDKYKFTVPDFYFSGHYTVYLKTDREENFELALNAKSGKETLNFIEYWIYETKKFVSVYNVDYEYIYFKFHKPVLKTQFIFNLENNNFEITEYNRTFPDEIVPVKHFNKKNILIFVGALYEDNKYDEAEFFIKADNIQTIPKEIFHVAEEKQQIDIRRWLITYKKSFKDKLNLLYKIKDTNLLNLILELKIYNFLFTELQDNFYKNLLDIVINVITYKYFKNGLFRLKPDDEYNINDTIEILFYLRDIYDFKPVNNIVEQSLAVIKKKKIKDNRLVIYNKKFSKDYRKLKKEIKQKISAEDDIYYKYMSDYL